MIFVQSETGMLFVMLSESDVSGLRQGQTRFVDQRQLKGRTFESCVLSLSKTDNDSLEMIRQAGHHVPQLKNPEPLPSESVCNGCQGLMLTPLLFEGKCICCWANQAKKLQTARN